MINVEVNFTVARSDQPAAIECLTKEGSKMHTLPGNRAYRILIDPSTDGAIILLHQWDDLASLDAYRNGPLFAAIGNVLRPMMTGAPSTAIYDATAIS